MLDTERKINQFLVQYARMLVGDIADERMVEQPLPGVNHPAWVLGHLAFSADRAGGLLGAAKELPAGWAPRFGLGSGPRVEVHGRLPRKGQEAPADGPSGCRLRLLDLGQPQVGAAGLREQQRPALLSGPV